jgi:putative flippase GtrA
VSVAEVEKVPAQAMAILAATPLNFIGNKLWSFGDLAGPRAGRRGR